MSSRGIKPQYPKGTQMHFYHPLINTLLMGKSGHKYPRWIPSIPPHAACSFCSTECLDKIRGIWTNTQDSPAKECFYHLPAAHGSIYLLLSHNMRLFCYCCLFFLYSGARQQHTFRKKYKIPASLLSVVGMGLGSRTAELKLRVKTDSEIRPKTSIATVKLFGKSLSV